jgi:cytoskeletal protein CcmA (bactofilin family)
MFSKPTKNTTDNLGKTNRIVQDTEIIGDIFSEADFRLDGTLKGNFTCNGKLVIGPKGKIIGDIKCLNLDIEGTFEGNVEVQQQIAIRAQATIIGHLKMNQLLVEAGANFNATCEMLGTQKLVEVE